MPVGGDLHTGRTTYTFDADGNQRSIEIPAGDVTTQTWSYENKLIQIEQPLDEVATYTYALVKRDNTEQRVTKDDDVDVIRFVWDEDRIITQLDDLGTVEAEYTLEPAAFGNLISQKQAADSSYYHYDALGSTRDLTDTAEVATDEYTYYAFGKPATTSGSTENPYQWVGELGYYHDAESGYDTLRARPYNATTGRFLGEDPIAADEENLYRYVGNNTVNDRDPSGLDADAKFVQITDRTWTRAEIRGANSPSLNGFVAGIDPGSSFLTRSVGNWPNTTRYSVTFSQAIIAVRSGTVTSYYDWDDWFRRNGWKGAKPEPKPRSKPRPGPKPDGTSRPGSASQPKFSDLEGCRTTGSTLRPGDICVGDRTAFERANESGALISLFLVTISVETAIELFGFLAGFKAIQAAGKALRGGWRISKKAGGRFGKIILRHGDDVIELTAEETESVLKRARREASKGNREARTFLENFEDVAPGGYKTGSFSISKWTGYPSGAPRPKGPFRLLCGAEYDAAVKAKTNANRALRRADPAKYANKQIHEIHPIKFGGSPTDPANKIALDVPVHRQFNSWWFRLQKKLEK